MRRWSAHVNPRVYLIVGFIALGAISLRIASNVGLGGVVGAVVAAGALLAIRTTNRWNKEALASFRRQGPKYDARKLLSEQRERMIKRGRDGATQEERK